MPKKRSNQDTEKLPSGIKSLVSKYKQTAANAAKSEEARQRLAREMVEFALKRERGRLRVAVHDLSKPKSKPKVTQFDLADPRAAALRLERFCNIKVAVPFWICAATCPIFVPFVAPPLIWVGYFLIFCDINLCDLTLTCYYIGI